MTTTAGRAFSPEAIGEMRQAEDPRVSPDGTMVAFIVSDVDLEQNRYLRRVFLCPSDGSEPARPFTGGPDDRLARWSPDGRLLAFVSHEPEGPFRLCVLPTDRGGERVVIATWPARLTEVAWSPDSSHIAFVARDPDPAEYGAGGEEKKARDMPPRRVTRLYSRLNGEGWTFDRPSRVMVVPSDGSTPPVRLTDGPFHASGISWSPDGRRLAFSSARHDDPDLDRAVDLFVVAADGTGQPERLTEKQARYSSPSWSPDGTRIAYGVDPTPGDSPRHHRIGVLDLATGTTADVAPDLDRNCGPHGYEREPVWWGDRLLCLVEDAGNLHVYSLPADGDGKPEPLVIGERWVSSFDVASGTLAVSVSSPTTFAEIVACDLSGHGVGGERRLTDLTGPVVRRRSLSSPLAYVARSEDGTEVPCWAVPPRAAEVGERYPTLLNIHGGPFTSYGNRFFDEFQMQSGAGFGVLYCNPRGSSGYSEAWGRAVRWPNCKEDPGSGWGGVDYEDVMACVDEALARFDWIDPERLGVLGGSYGGYMTSWVIGHTDRFRAACSERSCNNLLTLEHTSDIATSFKGYVGASHLDDPDAYLSHSPITFVEEMLTPVLILHSEDDLRCPISQAEELFVALRLLGRRPEFVRFPGENHELSRSGAPRHRVARAEIILDWFRRHLALD